MRTGADYVESLDDGRNVMLDGERVDNVATHPAFAGAVATMAHLYDVAADPARRDLFTYPSPTDGRPVHVWWQTPTVPDDLTRRRLAIEAWAEESCGFLGRSPDHVASFFAGFAGSLPLFAEAGQSFADNLASFYATARDESLYLSYTIIHPTIDRAKPPHEQYAPNLYVSVVDEGDDGIVLGGAQMLGTGSVMSDYVFVSCILPLGPGSEDYAISVVVPNNAPRLRIYSRRSYAVGSPGGHDYPLSTRFDETDSLVVFDDVFVPWEHVFVFRNLDLTTAQFNRCAAHSLGNTQAQIRFATKLRFYAGLAHRIADASGTIADPRTKLRLGELAAKCKVPETFVTAAEARCYVDDYGVVNPDHATLYAAMSLQPRLMNDVLYTLREMAGGSVIQLPSSFASFDDATSAADIDRFIRWPNASAVDRVKLLKLAWDAVGSEFAGRHQQYEMFYAGDPSVVNMRSFKEYRWPLADDLVERTLADPALLGEPTQPVAADV
jgi:4-hydroxyphenylacetate 3-monooxygenase